MEHRDFMNYISDLVVDELDLRDYDLYDYEIDSVKNFILDNDTDIINTFIEVIFEELINDYIEELIENRYKTYAVTFKLNLEKTINVRAKGYCNIEDELFNNEMFYDAVQQILINDGFGEIETTWINEVKDERCDIDLEKEDY